MAADFFTFGSGGLQETAKQLFAKLKPLIDSKLPTTTKYASSKSVGGPADKTVSIPMGSVDLTSTATDFKATVDGITELRSGVLVWLTNGVVTSAAGCTLNINNLGAKPIYNSIAATTATTTTFNVNYTMLFIYNATRVTGGCWDMVYGYDANTTYTPVKLGFGYATCTTAAATTAKVASLSSYSLVAGGLVAVNFSNNVPANATLNINSKGAKAIYYEGTAIEAGVINAGDTALFVYSTYYRLLSIDRWGTDIRKAYFKPSGGIPATDMTQAVQTSLDKADTALQTVPDAYRTAAAQDVIDEAQNAEIDELSKNKAPVILETASGPVASFPDGADGMPLKSLTVNIEPVQAAGTPAPETPLPISGWTGCNVTRAGKNLLDIDSVTSGAVDPDTGEVIPNTSNKVTPLIKCEPNTTYVLSGFVNAVRPRYYKSTVEYIGEASSVTLSNLTTPANCYFMRLQGANSAWRNAVNPQLELGSTATGYEPYVVAVYSITFPAEAGTVYGGTLTVNADGTGELRKRPYYASYNGETLVGPWVSSTDVYAPGTLPTIGAQVVDLGGEETVYQLTDLQVIDTFYGTNTIWADCGDVEITYRADTKIYVDDHSSSGAVNDVQVNGMSIVQGGVANVPLASASTPGVVISGTITVTGTTPTITAMPGVRYVCGEVATLDITLPDSGVVDVTFESGSTATVLTVTPPTGVTLKWANGFDPDNLAANTSYQIRVTDGEFGVADASGADSGAKSLGVTGAQVGDFVKVKAVDANGVPTAWEKASGLGTKVFEYELKDNWYKINVVSIEYETGVLTLEPNSALFTDDFTTTIRASIRPLIDGVTAAFRYGNIPPELYYDSSFYAVSVGENQVQLYKNATTPVSSLTNTGNVDLSRFQLWAEISRNRAIPDSEITGLLPNHHYRVRWVAPYGLHHFVAGPSFRRQDNSQYGNGYGTGYGASTIRGNTINTTVGLVSMNIYETVSLRGTYGWTINNLYCCLPLSFECDLYRISEKSWRLDVKTMAMAFYGNPIRENDPPTVTPFNHHIYLNNAPYKLRANFNGNSNTAFDGCRMTVWDMGEEY